MLLRLAAGIGFLALTSTTALAAPVDGPLQIIVSRDLQSLKVYEGDRVVATSGISSGKDGHATPTGIFSILEKKRMHHSNLYDDAPMPFMQRLTWSGIALHASNHVPAYPASHGCVRMPDDFARMLYKMTRRGGHVLVTGRETAPRLVNHPALFGQEEMGSPDPQLLSDAILRPTIPSAAEGSVEVAMSEPAATPPEPIVRTLPDDPARILITRRTMRDTLKDVQTTLNELGYDAGKADGLAGQQTVAAIRAFQQAQGMAVAGNAKQEVIEAVFAKANRGAPPTGQLFVRRQFEPVLEVPVEIRDPQGELGTHFLLARSRGGETDALDWFGVTMDNDLPAGTRKRLGIADAGSVVVPARDPIASALDRIVIPDDARRQVEALVGDGASLTIADAGYEAETGKGTDFIVLTRPGAYGSAYGYPTSTRRKESSIVTID